MWDIYSRVECCIYDFQLRFLSSLQLSNSLFWNYPPHYSWQCRRTIQTNQTILSHWKPWLNHILIFSPANWFRESSKSDENHWALTAISLIAWDKRNGTPYTGHTTVWWFGIVTDTKTHSCSIPTGCTTISHFTPARPLSIHSCGLYFTGSDSLPYFNLKREEFLNFEFRSPS